MKTEIVDNVLIETTYSISFQRRGDSVGSGWGFPCDEVGNVLPFKSPLAEENYLRCLSGQYDVLPPSIESYVNRIRLCSCGSEEIPEAVDDARGIFIANVCSKCRKERLKGYRLEVLEDSNYECDEPIDEDY